MQSRLNPLVCEKLAHPTSTTMQTCNAILLFSVSTNRHLPPSLVTLGIKGKLKFTLCPTKQSYGCQISLRELINIKPMKYLHSKWTYHVFYLQRKIHRLARNIIAFYQIFSDLFCFLTENTSLSHGKKQNQKTPNANQQHKPPLSFWITFPWIKNFLRKI